MAKQSLKTIRTARAGVILLLLFLALILIFAARNAGKKLVLSDGDTGEKIASFPLGEDRRFAVSFIHSVNKSPVEEWYEVRDDGIYAVACRYYAFGAGVATEVNPPQTVEILEDGSMLISGMEIKLDHLSYIVGTVYDHVLIINGEEISLREVCGRNRTVRFGVK